MTFSGIRLRAKQHHTFLLRYFRTRAKRNLHVSEDIIEEFSSKETTPLSLQQMKSFSNSSAATLRLLSAQFLHKELPIRFARAINQLRLLPLGLPATDGITRALCLYETFLAETLEQKFPQNKADEKKFMELLIRIKSQGSSLVPLICWSLHDFQRNDLSKSALKNVEVQDDITNALDSFFIARIGIRMLIGQYTESIKQSGGRVVSLCPREVAQEAVNHAAKLCKARYGWSPEVQITAGGNSHSGLFIYVYSHLHHMIFELTKNSMRAMVEVSNDISHKKSWKDSTKHSSAHNLDNKVKEIPTEGVTIYPMSKPISRKLAPIRIVISHGIEDITIKVSDEGGGICRSEWPKLWHYNYSTDTYYDGNQNSEESFRNHFSGAGYGLPISRLFARYFGGELTLISMEGFGTDAFLQLSRLGNKSELIPGNSATGIAPLKY